MQNLPHHLLWIPFLIVFVPAFIAALDLDKIHKDAPKFRGTFWSTFVLTSAVTRWFLAAAVPRVSPYRLDWPTIEWDLTWGLLNLLGIRPIHLLALLIYSALILLALKRKAWAD